MNNVMNISYSQYYLNQLYSFKDCENRIAVVDKNGSRKTSYKDFVLHVNSYAKFLKSNNIRKGNVIGIELPASMELYAFRFACHFIGAVFVSVNPDYIKSRKLHIYKETKAKLIINKETLKSIPVKEFKCQLNSKITDNDKGYIVYTSGTTDKPKGVLHNRSIYEVFHNCDKYYFKKYRHDLINDGKYIFGSMSDTTFVLSMFDMIFLLLQDTVHIIDSSFMHNIENIRNYIENNNINTTFCLPSLLNLLLPTKTLKLACILGESNTFDFSKFNTKVMNIYGASECPIMTIDEAHEKSFVSTNFKGSKLYLDKKNSEICYSGPGLFIRYINDKKLTNEVLTRNNDEIIYHTHDIAKKIGKNKYQIVGRSDFVVKILGKRISLTEIESNLKTINNIEDVVVKLSEHSNNVIVAFYTTKNKNVCNEKKLVSELANKLPSYMIPHEFVYQNSFKRNEHGKIIRECLDDKNVARNEYVAPRDEVEEMLCSAVEFMLLDTLPSSRIGIKDNLLKIGLNSLTGIAINSYLNEQNIFVPLDFMLMNPYICEWSEKISKSIDKDRNELKKVKKRSMNLDSVPITDTSIFFYEIIRNHNFIMKHVKIFNLAAIVELQNVEESKVIDCIYKLFDAHIGLKSRLVIKDGIPNLLKRLNWQPEISVNTINFEPDYKFFKKQIKPFNIDKDDLARVNLFTNNKKCYVLFDIHHLITDGFSQQLLVNDFLKLLNGEDIAYEKADCFDVALMFQDYLQSSKYKKDLKYYKELHNEIPFLKYPRSQSKLNFYRNSVKFVFNNYDEDKIFKYCLQNKISPPIFFISVLAKTLIDFCDSEKFKFVSLYHGRDKFYQQNTFACMFNAYPVVINDIKSREFEYLTHYLQDQIDESYKHKCLMSDNKDLISKHDIMINYLYDYEKNDEIYQKLPNGIKYRQIILNSKKMTQRASTPLTINVTGGFNKGVIQFGAKYNQSLFSEKEMRKLVDYFEDVINSVID